MTYSHNCWSPASSDDKKYLLPAIRYGYYDMLLSGKVFLTELERRLEEHPLFKTALATCHKVSCFYYQTSLYPIFIIIKEYISVYKLVFLKIEYCLLYTSDAADEL